MSTLTGQSYPVGKSTHTCAATGRALAEGEPLVAVLVEHTADGRVERLDYSHEAWLQGSRPGTDWWQLGHWKSTARNGPRRKPVLDDDTMLEMVEQFADPQPKAKALRLVLALMLVQRRVLVQVRQDAATLVLRKRGLPLPPEGPEPLRVEDPGLDEATLAEVAADLEALSGDRAPANGAASGVTP